MCEKVPLNKRFAYLLQQFGWLRLCEVFVNVMCKKMKLADDARQGSNFRFFVYGQAKDIHKRLNYFGRDQTFDSRRFSSQSI